MTFEHLTSRLDLDASSYVDEADDAAGASDDVAHSADTMSESLFDVDAAGVAAGGALAGLGTAAQSTLDSTRETREELSRVAQQTDLTEDEVTDLTTSLSDATLSHEEVTGAMREFQGLGAETEDEMREYVEAADTIADATGSSADAIAQDLAPQVRALDGDLDGLEENMDAFVMAAEESSLEIDDIGRNLGQLDFEPLREMGVESDEAALAMAEFADKTGLPPKQLRSEFRSAVEESDGDLQQFEENLGFTEGTLEDLTDGVEENAGIAEEQADAVGEQASTMDRLRARMDDAKLAAADYLGPLDAIAPAAQAAGVGLIGLSTVNVGAVAPSFATVAAAAAPVTAAVLGVAAAGALLYAAWERDIGGIQDRTKAGVGMITDSLDTLVDGIGWAIEIADYILTEWSPGATFQKKKESMLEPVNDVREAIPGSFDEATDLAMDIFTTWHPAGILWSKRDEIMDAAGDVRDGLEERVEEAVARGTDIFLDWHPAGIIYNKRDEIMDALPIPDEWKDRGKDLVGAFTEGVREQIPSAEDAIGSMADAADEYLPSSDADKGAFSRLTDAGAAVPETLAGAADTNMQSLESVMAEMPAPSPPADPAANGQTSGENSNQLTRGDIRDAFLMALEEVQLMTRLDIDDREFGRVVEDRAEVVFEEVNR